MFSGVRFTLISLVVLLAATFVLPAAAAPPGPNALSVHVVAVKSDDALDQAEALTVALKKAVRDSDGWYLGDSEQSLEFLALKMDCTEPIDAACEGRIAEVLKADRYLWAVISFDKADKSKVVGTLNFYVRGKGTNRYELNYSANLTDPNVDALIEVTEAAVNKVTGGPPTGSLKLATGGVAGQIFVDDKPMGALAAEGATFQLPSGEHRVVVKAPGYEDAEGTTTVKPASTVELVLTLIPLPEDKPLDARLIGGFGALAVGVGAGAVGLWAALQVSSIDSDANWKAFIASVPVGGANACERAKNGTPGLDYATQYQLNINDFRGKCDDAATFEVVQAVMFPVAGVAAGVGLYLIMTSDFVAGEGDSALQIVPLVTPDTQAVTVSYTF